MRRFLLFPCLLLLAFTVAACDSESGDPVDTENGQPTDGNSVTPGSNGRYLVVYCSRSGNTEAMAEDIRNSLDCDMLEVLPTIPYDEDYNSMLQRSQQEQAAIEQGDYPSIQTSVTDFTGYDMIFIGYPIWYSHMATPMQTFLYNHAELLKGKPIALFASSGSSGMTTSVNDARSLCPEGTFSETLLLTSSTLGQRQTHIARWLEQLGVTQ